MTHSTYKKNYHYMTQEQRALKRKRANRIYQIKKRLYLSVASLLLIITISLLIGTTSSKASNVFEPTLNVKYSSILIQSDDTLWSIAKEQTAHIPELSCQEYIKEVKNINGMKSDTLYYGTYLIIPVYSYLNR